MLDANEEQLITGTPQGAPSRAQKELMKRSRKLREILRIEEQLAQGGSIDHLQRQKIARRGEVEEQVAAARRAVEEEELHPASQTTAPAVTAVPQPARSLPQTVAVVPLCGTWDHQQYAQAAPMAAMPASAPQQMPPRLLEAPGSTAAVALFMPPQPNGLSGPMPPMVQPSSCSQPQATVFLCPATVPQTQAVFHPGHHPAEVPELVAASGGMMQHIKHAQHFAEARALAQACRAHMEQTSPFKEAEDERQGHHAKRSAAHSGEAASLESFREALQVGGDRKEVAVARLRGNMVRKSLEAKGCWEVQTALQALDRKTVGELLSELHGHVLALIRSPYGNYVVQKVIEVMPPAQAGFIVAELRGCAVSVARHRFGCRILCRLLEHFTGDAGLSSLLDELLLQAEELVRHPFAHHTTQAVLEHGLPEHRRKVCEALCWELLCNASDRHASFVVEAVLTSAHAEDQEMLAQAMLQVGADGLSALAQTRFGSHVVRALLRCPGAASIAAAAELKKQADVLFETKYGRRLLQDLGVARRGQVRHAAVAA